MTSSMQSLSRIAADEKQGSDGVRLYLGTVVDNNDPDQTQRVRITVPGVLEADDITQLPWVLPSLYSKFGMGDNYGVVHVPRIGSRVALKMQDGDASYSMKDCDVATASGTWPSELMTNYPNRVGSVSPQGKIEYEDMSDGSVFWRLASGTGFLIDGLGNMSLVIAGNFAMVVNGDYALSVEGNLGQVVKGNASEQITGMQYSSAGNGSQQDISGSQQVTVSGTRNIMCSSESHKGNIDNIGDITANGISLDNHEHISSSPGNPTSPPIAS